MKMKREKTAALVIDYQEKLMPAMHNREAFIARSRILLQGLNAMDIPMIVSEQYPKGLGVTVPEIKEVLGVVPILPKTTFSCLDNDAIRTAVEATECDTVLICGSEAHICVLQSAIDLKAAGKEVFIVEDCVASRFPHDMEMSLRRAEEEGIYLTTTEAVLFELLGKASGQEFKTVSKLIK